MIKVMSSTAAKTFWDYQAIAKINAALGNQQKAVEYQKRACDVVKAGAPPRFSDIAQVDLKSYAADHRQQR